MFMSGTGHLGSINEAGLGEHFYTRIASKVTVTEGVYDASKQVLLWGWSKWVIGQCPQALQFLVDVHALPVVVGFQGDFVQRGDYLFAQKRDAAHYVFVPHRSLVPVAKSDRENLSLPAEPYTAMRTVSIQPIGPLVGLHSGYRMCMLYIRHTHTKECHAHRNQRPQ